MEYLIGACLFLSFTNAFTIWYATKKVTRLKIDNARKDGEYEKLGEAHEVLQKKYTAVAKLVKVDNADDLNNLLDSDGK